MDNDTTDAAGDGERKRKASKSPSPPPNASTKRSKSNAGTAANPPLTKDNAKGAEERNKVEEKDVGGVPAKRQTRSSSSSTKVSHISFSAVRQDYIFLMCHHPQKSTSSKVPLVKPTPRMTTSGVRWPFPQSPAKAAASGKPRPADGVGGGRQDAVEDPDAEGEMDVEADADAEGEPDVDADVEEVVVASASAGKAKAQAAKSAPKKGAKGKAAKAPKPDKVPAEPDFPAQDLQYAWYENVRPTSSLLILCIDIRGLQPRRCNLCIEAGVACYIAPLFTSTCFFCQKSHKACSNITGNSKGQGIGSCYILWRWWKKVCEPQQYPGPHPFPKESLRQDDTPTWFVRIHKRLHGNKIPPRPPAEEARGPCGIPTIDNRHYPFFDHLGHPEPEADVGGSAPVVKTRKGKGKSQPAGGDDEVVEVPPQSASSAGRARKKTKAQSVPADGRSSTSVQGGSGQVRANRAYILVPPLSYRLVQPPAAGHVTDVLEADAGGSQRGISVPITKVGPPCRAKRTRSPDVGSGEEDADIMSDAAAVQEERGTRRRKLHHVVVASDEELEQLADDEVEIDKMENVDR